MDEVVILEKDKKQLDTLTRYNLKLPTSGNITENSSNNHHPPSASGGPVAPSDQFIYHQQMELLNQERQQALLLEEQRQLYNNPYIRSKYKMSTELGYSIGGGSSMAESSTSMHDSNSSMVYNGNTTSTGNRNRAVSDSIVHTPRQPGGPVVVGLATSNTTAPASNTSNAVNTIHLNRVSSYMGGVSHGNHVNSAVGVLIRSTDGTDSRLDK